MEEALAAVAEVNRVDSIAERVNYLSGWHARNMRSYRHLDALIGEAEMCGDKRRGRQLIRRTSALLKESQKIVDEMRLWTRSI